MDAQFPGIDLWHKIRAKARDLAHLVDRARAHVQKSSRFLSRYPHLLNAAYFLLKLRKFRYESDVSRLHLSHGLHEVGAFRMVDPDAASRGPPQWMNSSVLFSWTN